MNNLYLGADLSLSSTGITIIDNNKNIVFTTNIKTSSKLTEAARFEQIGDTIENILKIYKPTEIIIEDVFRGKNIRTLITLVTVRGLLVREANRAKIPWRLVSTCTMKSWVLGFHIAQPKAKRGQPKPPQIDFKELCRLKLIEIYNLPENTSNDTTDSLGIALCGVDNIYDKPKLPKPKKPKKNKRLK
jgi:Holliday junction resolvasome RuvABC endonuclease subunit